MMIIDGSPHSQCGVEYLTRFPFQNEKELFLMHVLPLMSELDQTVYIGRYSHHYIEILPVSSYETEVAIARQAEFEGQVDQALLTEIIEALHVSSVETTSVLKRGDAATEIIESVKSQNIHLVFACSRAQCREWVMLGSVSHKLAICWVLMVRELGGVSV